MTSILRIDEAVTMEFFEHPGLKYDIDHLFKSMDKCINYRISDIRNISCIKNSEFADDISHEKIFLRFKYRFLKMLLDEAVEMSLREKGKYDVLSNVNSLISEKKLDKALYGEIIVDAVIDVIKKIETTRPMQIITLSGIIATVKQYFLGVIMPH